MSFTIFQNEKRLFQAIKRRSSKSRKIDFFSKGVNPWFRSKNGQFQNFFLLGNTGQENVFYDILERIKAFVGYKNKKFKKSKNLHFSKGVNPQFWTKIAIFQLFYLGNISQKNVFYDILERKNAFLGYKNKKFEKSKHSPFSKGVKPWFLSKNGFFGTFIFYVIQARKMSFTIFQNEKRLF